MAEEMIYKKVFQYLCQECGHEYEKTMTSVDKYIETTVPKCPMCQRGYVIIKSHKFFVDKVNNENV